MLLVAVREDLSSLVAPVAALGPAFTVGWAWAVLREPVVRPQVVGLGVALVGLVMIAAG
jgi:drug/metabolite transporter (DMT)-like permease